MTAPDRHTGPGPGTNRASGSDRGSDPRSGRRSGTGSGTGRIPPRLITGIRLLMFVVFTVYGLVKLFGGQYDYGDWTISHDTPDGTSVVWAFYGYSEIYGRFTGLYELVPALMLLSRRTATLGAMALFAVSLNITVMDFAYGYPSVKYFSLAYTLLCLFLVVQDRQRLLAVFWHGRELPEAPAAPGTSGRR